MPRTRSHLGWEHDNAYSTGPNTGEAFPAIIGGRYPQKIGLIPSSSVANEFEDYCAGVSTNHLLAPKYGYDEGFDEFSCPSEDSDGVKDKAARYVSQGSLPYRLGAWAWNVFETIYPSPFTPSFRPASDVIEDFKRIQGTHDDWFVWLHFMEPHHPYEPVAAGDRLHARHVSRSVIAGATTTDETAAQVRSFYQQEVQELDGELEQLWTALPDDTRVVFCADHGELLGEGGEWGHIGTFRTEVLQVPLGGINVPEPGALASAVDVPTLLLGREHNEGSLDRDIAYATNGVEWAATDGRDIATPEGVFRVDDGSKSDNGRLERARSKFDVKPSAIEGADTEDLEQLGYL